MAPTALSSSATFVSSSKGMDASAKEFVPGSFAATGAAPCTGFHFDPSAREFSPQLMSVPHPNPGMNPGLMNLLINFSDYSSDEDDDDDTPRPAPKPVASPVKPKVEEPVATQKVTATTVITQERSDDDENADELCKGNIAVAPWKRKQSDSPKSPASQKSEGQVADSRPWRKTTTEIATSDTSSKPWRPWHTPSTSKKEEEDNVSASLSDASTETPISMGGSSIEQISTAGTTPKSEAPESADDQDSDGVDSPCSRSSAKESPPSRLTANLGAYLGPQRPRASVPVFSVMEMLKWRTASADLKADNFTYFMDIVDEVPPASGGAKTAKGNWREDAQRAQRTSRNARRGDARGSWNSKPDEEGSSPQKSQEEVLLLPKSENSWAARQEERRSKKALNPDGKTDDEIVRSMKSILNKLTIEKYDKLYLQMLNTGISTVEHVKILIHEVMEKAQTQHHFIEMYSTFCVHLHEWFNENQVSDDPKTGFKRILLNECQCLFERCLKQEDHADLTGEELAEAKAKYKTTMLGNIKFVGALLGKRMLATSVLVAIAEDLISEPSTPEALESLAVFLTSIGGTFDRPDWQHHKRLEAIFQQLEVKKSDKKVPARIRFLIQDVLDLRATGWEDQKKATKKIEGPMKLEDVHEKASQEELSKNEWTETKNEWRDIQSRASQRSWRD